MITKIELFKTMPSTQKILWTLCIISLLFSTVTLILIYNPQTLNALIPKESTTEQTDTTHLSYPLKSLKDRNPLTPIIENNTKHFYLEASPIHWEYKQNQYLVAWAYNNQIPGPQIRVTEGDHVKITLKNNLFVPTSLHWHGLEIPYTQDGLPGITQQAIQPNTSYTYEFIAKPQGTRFYHTHGSTHGDEAQQLDMGLSGAFIIEPKQPTTQQNKNTIQNNNNDNNKNKFYDKEYTLILDEWEILPDGQNAANPALQQNNKNKESTPTHSMNYNLYTINGRAFPDTEPIVVKENDKILLRLINAGTSATHPIHIHGHSFKIIATDGNPVPLNAIITKDTINIAPGERYDLELIANNPGIWITHCHELHHADAGMVIPLIYEGYSLNLSQMKNTNTISHTTHQ